jgi:hypothetical protein
MVLAGLPESGRVGVGVLWEAGLVAASRFFYSEKFTALIVKPHLLFRCGSPQQCREGVVVFGRSSYL